MFKRGRLNQGHLNLRCLNPCCFTIMKLLPFLSAAALAKEDSGDARRAEGSWRRVVEHRNIGKLDERKFGRQSKKLRNGACVIQAW